MATVPIDDKEPTAIQRAATTATKARLPLALVALGALVTLAPAPFDAAAAALVVIVALGGKR